MWRECVWVSHGAIELCDEADCISDAVLQLDHFYIEFFYFWDGLDADAAHGDRLRATAPDAFGPDTPPGHHHAARDSATACFRDDVAVGCELAIQCADVQNDVLAGGNAGVFQRTRR